MERKKLNQPVKFSLVMVIALALLQGCGSVPFTGRRQLSLVSNEQVVALSLQQYQDFMRSAPLERSTTNAEMVKRVGSRIANAVEK
jgi:hypothetical protein